MLTGEIEAVVDGKNMHTALQIELEEKIRHRKRSQSVSSKTDKVFWI